MNFLKGELVTRESYNNDLLFRVKSVMDDQVIIQGVDMRLEADAPKNDLNRVDDRELHKRKEAVKEQEAFSYRLFRQDYRLMEEKRNYEITDGYSEDVSYFHIPTKVLHLDGDQIYLRKCINLYEQLGLQVHGVHLSEKDMSHEIGDLIRKIQPEIVVITGHDAYLKSKGEKKDLRAYRNSIYFSETVREARKIKPSLDQLVIFAGACQSHFESLIRSGANFASSPARINIHALDPVYVVAKIAYTSFMEKINVWEVLRNTFTGEKGMGGIETKGLHRIGMPYITENDININENSNL